MKKLLLSASVILLATGAFAQTKRTGSDARFGLKAGVNLSSYNGTGIYDLDYKNNIGYNVTAYGDFGIGNNFFLQPGISLQNKGAKIETTGTVTFKQDVMAIEVPINAVVKIPTGDAGAFQISAGPYVGFNISGKNKYPETYTSTTVDLSTFKDRDLNFGSAVGDDLSSIDFGANFGLAYRLNSGVSIGANYGLGISNLIPKDERAGDDKLRNRIIGFTIGYSL
ncbi:porin family protein [Pedobacter lithocola]|uniref:Porin family protein n=1 Tax=Pedobacter lithocola TaxID=1908239 RepID=A0ABV8P2X6_9SPHI